MNPATLTQAQGLADFLERQPLAGFLALTLLALIAVFALFMLEKRAHQRTLREVVTLTTTFAERWNTHQELEARMLAVLERRPPSTQEAT